ncbi:hypothetical protein QYE76_047141 [Lolium multiflorum]|uniref:F-box domain-containing protein n=1 Tax=Lolium multiflorum TaxID=4521 RepID=A0AAD8TQW8_LOLMU|nr:hypothetical protein QYE76_047141 [Lolium multiflorum]
MAASHRQGGDRLSALPDRALEHVLSNLTSVEAVRTSVLSRRWRDVYEGVPVVDLVDTKTGQRCDSFDHIKICFDYQVASAILCKGPGTPIRALRLTVLYGDLMDQWIGRSGGRPGAGPPVRLKRAGAVVTDKEKALDGHPAGQAPMPVWTGSTLDRSDRACRVVRRLGSGRIWHRPGLRLPLSRIPPAPPSRVHGMSSCPAPCPASRPLSGPAAPLLLIRELVWSNPNFIGLELHSRIIFSL